MAYFNHAYVKSAVISSTEANADVKTSALTTGELGLVDAADYETVAFPAANDAKLLGTKVCDCIELVNDYLKHR